MTLPSEIRARILEDHARLRVGMHHMHRACEQLRAGDEAAQEALWREAEAFATRFLEHLALEERELVPVLRTVDAWGEERARRVLDEHAGQRGTVRDLLRRIRAADADPSDLAGRILGFAEELAADMLHEEETVLHPDLLRDDVVALDAFGG